MALDRYNPADFEESRYQHWLDDNLFAPSMDPGRETFCIVIPPPNVTGSLHMGHAWDETLQDVLIRWKRMAGYNTLWIPGMDHAGIATQWMVERMLLEKGITKEDLGREKFVEEVWRFKESSHKTITRQLRRLGVSCDWNRERFTLDEGLSRAVRRVFATLYHEGLIYRAHRMVSWCPRCLTALSDLEVNHQDIDGGMWHIRYPFADGSGHVVVATTRPETMLGDTGVAVHPQDERYKSLVGKTVILPLAEREIPIVADEFVDQEFGSGAVKVTPGHDPNDFDAGKRTGLEVVSIFNDDASLNDQVPPAYRGLDRFEARKRVVADLEAAHLLVRHERHTHSVGTCSRCGTIVEPRVSLQWFVNMKEMALAAVKAVEQGEIRLLPEFQEKIFFEWMNNIQDWCVSRQLWWGHRIPVWYCGSCGEVLVSEEQPVRCSICQGSELVQDPDVLDTWFSSGLWPFSTMGWPEETEDLATFYPTSTLVTGYDILFFWVARMAMLGIKFLGRVPFREVLLHGLLRDAAGEKMSKTKGNGIDPLEAIAEFGTDALRFTLAAQSVMGRDMVLQKSTIEGYRNFINKIWNAAKFLQGHRERLGQPAALEFSGLGLFERWIVGRLQKVVGEVDRHLEARRFNEACREVYGFVWHEYCDWYLEISKPVLYGDMGENLSANALATLNHVLLVSLELLHPFMPFVTEELWQHLEPGGGSIMVRLYPQPREEWIDEDAMERAGRLIEVISAVRGVRGENQIKPKQRVDLVVASADDALHELLAGEQTIFSTLAGVGEMSLVDQFEAGDGHASAVGRGFEIFLSLHDQIDVAQERERIGRELQKTQAKIGKLNHKLGNLAFVKKAPASVVSKNREELSALEAQSATLGHSLNRLPSSDRP